MKVTKNNSDWKFLYQQSILTTISPLQHKNSQQWKLLFPWFLLPAILLLSIALFPFNYAKNISQSLPILFSFILILGLTNVYLPVYADENSLKSSYKTTVLQGVDAYKNANFGLSTSHFIQSVLNAHTNQERAIALHNLGNALFQTGNYEKASEIFTDALRYAPKQQQSIKNQALSTALFTLLERERKRQQGRGNFAAPNDNSTLSELPEQMPFMLSTKAVNLLKASLPEIPKKELNHLLNKGIQHIRLIQGNNKESFKKQKQQQDIEQARIYFMGLEENKSNALWKRLFEIEEGFPGKLSKPKNIPKVLPW